MHSLAPCGSARILEDSLRRAARPRLVLAREGLLGMRDGSRHGQKPVSGQEENLERESTGGRTLDG